jgi:ankyrin repeat protein
MNRRVDQELMEAAAENNQLAVLRLLSVGADVNTKDSISGMTPLHKACYHEYLQVVQALLEHRADS